MLQNAWQTWAHSADPSAPTGVTVVTDLRALRIAGPDAETFLQGYLTIDTASLSPGNPRLAAVTNLKGRVVANGWCQKHSDGVIDWTIHFGLADRITTFLEPYLRFSRSDLEPVAEEHLLLGFIPEDAAPHLRLVTADDKGLDDAALAELLKGCRPVDEAAWRFALVDARIPIVSQPVSEQFLPQMLGLVDAGAIDFDKGCYLGQEVVARAQHRGAVKRSLVRLQTAGEPPAPGADIVTGTGEPAGTVVFSASGEPSRCLAVVRQPPATVYRSGGVDLRTV